MLSLKIFLVIDRQRSRPIFRGQRSVSRYCLSSCPFWGPIHLPSLTIACWSHRTSILDSPILLLHHAIVSRKACCRTCRTRPFRVPSLWTRTAPRATCRSSCSQVCVCWARGSHPQTRVSPGYATAHSMAWGQAWQRLDCKAVSAASSPAQWAPLEVDGVCQLPCLNLPIGVLTFLITTDSRTSALNIPRRHPWSRNLYINLDRFNVPWWSSKLEVVCCDPRE